MSLQTDLLIKISAENKADAEISSIEGRMSKLGGMVSKVGGVVTGVIGGSVVGALADAARAAADDEANVLRLQQAVENSGASWEANADAIAARVAVGQQLAFSDTETRDSLNSLVSITGDVSKAMELQTAAMDLARGKGIDLGTASEIIGKVAEGNVGILKRYGVTLGDNATAQEALGVLQQKFGGQAETYGNTASAAMFRVKDAVGEWQEQMGAALGPAQNIVGLLPGLQSGMSLAGGAVGALSSVVKLTAIPSLVAMAIPFAPILLAIAAIGAAVVLLKIAWDNDFGGIRETVQSVLGFITNLFDVFQRDGLGGLLKEIIGFALSVPQKFVEMGKGIVAGLLNGLGNLKTEIWNTLVAAFSGIDFWVGPFHISSSGISVQMPSISLPTFKIPGFAEGGIVTRPTLAMVGEAGPEMITPLGRGGGSMGQVININVSGNIATSERELAERIAHDVGDVLIRSTLHNRNLAY